MDISIGVTLAGLRRAKKMMQKDVATRLSGYGINISAKTIHNWEKSIALPNARQFVALCDVLDVDDVMWQFAGVIRGPYAGLNQAGRSKAREFIEILRHVDMYRDKSDEGQEESRKATRLLRLYDIAVSAGTGNFLDESGYEMIPVPDTVPASADFAVRVSGDSMEPLYTDGSVIWITEQEVLNSGEIGIFVYSGDVFCKKLIVDDGKVCLRSLNESYEEIEIKEDFGFRAIGKVVSRELVV